MNERIIRLKKENGSLKTDTAEMEMDSKCLKVATICYINNKGAAITK